MIALLPLRKYSSRIKNKNLKLFASRPLYHWVSETLKDSNKIDKVLVYTCDREIISDVEKNFPEFEICLEEKEMSEPKVTANTFIKSFLEKSYVEIEEPIIQVHATSPFLTPETIDLAIKSFNKLNIDSLFAVSEVLKRVWYENKPINHNLLTLSQTQNLNPVMLENSLFYIFKPKKFLEEENRICGNYKMFVINNKVESIDIDDEQDWIIAETIKRELCG